MISLFADTRLSTLAFVLFSGVWAPLMHISQTAIRIFTFLLDPHHQPETGRSGDNPSWELDLPVDLFRDLDPAGEETCTCSICLSEFLAEDYVNKLPKCGHVFHVSCMDRWLNSCRFTCPLCRSLLLCVRPSPCREQTTAFCVELLMS